MRALKVVPALLALTLAVPAFAEAPAGQPPAAAARKAGAKDKKDHAAKREARLLEALKKQGIADAQAKKVVAVAKKYQTEKKPVREDSRTHKQNLRRLSDSPNKDQAAIQKELDALKANREKLDKIHDREIAELNTFLKPSERAKVMQVMQRGKNHHKGAHKGDSGKNKAAKNKTQRANG